MNDYKILCLEVIVLKYQKNLLKNEVERLLIKIYIVLILEKRLLAIFIKVSLLLLHVILMINIIHFITPFLPLNDKVMENLKKVGKIYYENQDMFSGLGLFVLRFTIQPFWNKLPDIQKRTLLEMKKSNPDEFNTVFYGFEFLDSDATIFPFQKNSKILTTIWFKTIL